MTPRNRVLSGMVNCLRQAAGGIVPVGEIADWIWGDDPDGGPEDVRNCVELAVMRLRGKGFPIVSHHGRGYSYRASRRLPSNPVIGEEHDAGASEGALERPEVVTHGVAHASPEVAQRGGGDVGMACAIVLGPVEQRAGRTALGGRNHGRLIADLARLSAC